MHMSRRIRKWEKGSAGCGNKHIAQYHPGIVRTNPRPGAGVTSTTICRGIGWLIAGSSDKRKKIPRRTGAGICFFSYAGRNKKIIGNKKGSCWGKCSGRVLFCLNGKCQCDRDLRKSCFSSSCVGFLAVYPMLAVFSASRAYSSISCSVSFTLFGKRSFINF